MLATEEGQNIAKALGPTKHSVILQNHGILTTGGTIEAAVQRFIALERHCQVMLLSEPAAAARGTKPVVIEDEEAAFTHKQVAGEALMHFQARSIFEKVAKLSGDDYKK